MLALWRLKVALSVALTLFFCVPYFTLQRFPVFPVRTLETGWIDDAIGFVPGWVWVYQSVYLLMSIVPWCLDSAADLRRYARGFVLQSSIGFAFFFFLPIAAPRPEVVPPDVMFRILVSYDRTLNSFPSLHVGLSVYTVLFAASASRRRIGTRRRTPMLALLWTWAVAIAFSALATKQHYFIDLPAGALLAWLSHRWSFTASSERSLHAQSIRSRDRGCPPHGFGELPTGVLPAAGAAAARTRAAAGGEPTG